MLGSQRQELVQKTPEQEEIQKRPHQFDVQTVTMLGCNATDVNKFVVLHQSAGLQCVFNKVSVLICATAACVCIWLVNIKQLS